MIFQDQSIAVSAVFVWVLFFLLSLFLLPVRSIWCYIYTPATAYASWCSLHGQWSLLVCCPCEMSLNAYSLDNLTIFWSLTIKRFITDLRSSENPKHIAFVLSNPYVVYNLWDSVRVRWDLPCNIVQRPTLQQIVITTSMLVNKWQSPLIVVLLSIWIMANVDRYWNPYLARWELYIY